MALFAWPPQTLVGRIITKKKLFEQSPPGGATRELFTRQVDRIVWEAKLAQSTVNLTRSEDVPEIHVFSLHLKVRELHPEVPRFLDRAVPFPLIFEVHFGDEVKTVAAPKRNGPTAEHRWIMGDYFSSPWLANGAERRELPVALDLKSLYAALLAPLLPAPVRQTETLAEAAARMVQVAALEKKIAQLTTQMNKEKQFNRRVEINGQVNVLRHELALLTQGDL